mmetsp:Transcript_107087/g.302840  ORF Transcript_107087/g.302840 Transcript_107087/m.302840 type:complete len:263 (+) Transcript_107087:629-1417(+)
MKTKERPFVDEMVCQSVKSTLQFSHLNLVSPSKPHWSHVLRKTRGGANTCISQIMNHPTILVMVFIRLFWVSGRRPKAAMRYTLPGISLTSASQSSSIHRSARSSSSLPFWAFISACFASIFRFSSCSCSSVERVSNFVLRIFAMRLSKPDEPARPFAVNARLRRPLALSSLLKAPTGSSGASSLTRVSSSPRLARSRHPRLQKPPAFPFQVGLPHCCIMQNGLVSSMHCKLQKPCGLSFQVGLLQLGSMQRGVSLWHFMLQ